MLTILNARKLLGAFPRLQALAFLVAASEQGFMRVVVTGSAGQLGTVVLRKLIDDRKIKKVVSLDRRPPYLASGKLETVLADVRDADLARHFERADAVIHLAFIVTTKVPAEVFEAVNVEGSKNVFRAAAAAGVQRVAYASSIAAYGVVPGHPVPITESCERRFQPEFPYAAAKYRVEEFLDAFEAEHPEIAVARIRPSILIGTHIQNPLGRLFQAALDRGRLPISTPSPEMPLVWDEDVAAAFHAVITRGARGAFNVSADDPLPGRELAERSGLRPISAPRLVLSLAKVVGALFSDVDPTWDLESAAPMIISSERAKTELGWKRSADTCADVLRRYIDLSPGKVDPKLAAALRVIDFASRTGAPDSELERLRAIVHLELTGKGGGDFTVRNDGGHLRIVEGRPAGPTSAMSMDVATFRSMLSGELSLGSAQFTGRVRFEGDTSAAFVLGGILGRLKAGSAAPSIRGRATRAMLRWFRS
jgi:nucleoside-diphosphate-sugar epimerase